MDKILSNYKTGLKSFEHRRLVDFIYVESLLYGFNPELILAVITTESSFYNWSVSKKGALGMMQILPATGRALAKSSRHIAWNGSKDTLFDPYVNIQLGIQYLHKLNNTFSDLRTALTAYNYGPTRVRRWIRRGKSLPTGYADRVLRAYRSYLPSRIPASNAT
ncbi:MAG: lytic transglycosylase domain-containing protein [Nitrospiria bacterium]